MLLLSDLDDPVIDSALQVRLSAGCHVFLHAGFGPHPWSEKAL